MILSITQFIGRLHPALVHLPIGILLLAVMMQWMSTKEKYRPPAVLLTVVWLCGFLSALASCVSGYILSGSDDYDSDAVFSHQWMGISVAVFSGVIFLVARRGAFEKQMRWLSLALLVLVIVAGHLGGSLTRGPDYLQSALRAESADTIPVAKIITNIQQAVAYADVVQPLLNAKCRSCHGPQRQKGGLRMDDAGRLIRGGKDGPVIMAGNASGSELIKRILLPPEDEHHMPPKAKSQLNDNQIALLQWWIDQGADTSKKIKDIPQPPRMAAYLLSLQGAPKRKDSLGFLPAGAMQPAAERDLAALRKKDWVVLPLGWQSNWLSIDFVNAAGATDTDLALLLPVKAQIASLKLGHTAISDKAGKIIAQCPNITFLQLDHTAVTDSILPMLAGLRQLQIVNLVGTSITASGLEVFRGLKNLRTVYLYQTGVHSTDWPQLKRWLPAVRLDTGGYAVPLLQTDTMIVKASAVKNK